MTTRAEVIKQPVMVVIATFALLLCLAVLRVLFAPVSWESCTIDSSLVAQYIDNLFVGSYTWAVVVSTLFALVNAVVVTRIITRYSVYTVKTVLSLVLFVMFVCSGLFAVGSPSIGLLLFAVSHAAELTIGTFRRDKSYSNVMLSAFWLGVAVLLYPPTVILAVAQPFILLLYKRSAREIAAGVVMFVVPIVLVEAVQWFTGGRLLSLSESLVAGLLQSTGGFDWSIFASGAFTPVLMITYGLDAALVVASIVLSLVDFPQMRLRARKVNIQFIVMLVCAAAMLLSGGNPAVTLPLAGLCCVPIVNYFFVRCSGMVGIILYVVTVLGTAIGTILRFFA